MYRAIGDELQLSSQNLDHVRICVSGGAPLSSSLKQQFEAQTGSTLVEGYGLSEASPLTHCNPLFSHQKKDSIGLPCPNTQARIVHLRTGKVLPQNSVGELEVKGPQVMRSYWKNERETKNVLRSGWLSTGDIAYMDQDGFFYIMDRKKDLILSGGFNVYPSEVEDVLSQHPDIKETAIVGETDDYYGEIIKAFIVPRNGRVCEEQELINFCKKNLAYFKVPKRFVFVDSLPKNFLGKVVKRKLKNSLQNR
jgi:long-chain acyl-CoA synthetase